MIFGLRVTQNFFDTLGVAPRFGRNFTADEDRPSGWHVVVLSHPYWVRQFGGRRTRHRQNDCARPGAIRDRRHTTIQFPAAFFHRCGQPTRCLGAARLRHSQVFAFVRATTSMRLRASALASLSRKRAPRWRRSRTQLVREFPKRLLRARKHLGPAVCATPGTARFKLPCGCCSPRPASSS